MTSALVVLVSSQATTACAPRRYAEAGRRLDGRSGAAPRPSTKQHAVSVTGIALPALRDRRRRSEGRSRRGNPRSRRLELRPRRRGMSAGDANRISGVARRRPATGSHFGCRSPALGEPARHGASTETTFAAALGASGRPGSHFGWPSLTAGDPDRISHGARSPPATRIPFREALARRRRPGSHLGCRSPAPGGPVRHGASTGTTFAASLGASGRPGSHFGWPSLAAGDRDRGSSAAGPPRTTGPATARR
jgi:hypothetical protein